MRIYYAQSTPISVGSVILFKENSYLIINQDAIESNVYYTSIAVKCDLTLKNSAGINIPFALDDESYGVTSTNVVDYINGTAIIYTGLNSNSQLLQIDDCFYCFGGYYKIGNIFYNNNLAYVYLMKDSMPSVRYSLTYNGDTTLKLTDNNTYQLSYTAMKNDEVYENPSLIYVSSDDTIATVNEAGLVTLFQEGTVTITATWTDEKYISCETTITVSNISVQEPITGTLTLSGRNDIIRGYHRTINAIYSDADGNDVSNNYTTVWTITDATFDTSLLTISNDDTNSIKLSFEDSNIVGETFVLNAVDSDGVFNKATLSMKLTTVF